MIQITLRERKKEMTQNKIIDIAIDLFRKQGFDLTSMEQIATEAFIAKGTLYNYFSNKEAIIHHFMRRVIEDNETELNAIIENNTNTHSRLLVLLKKLFEWNKSNEDIVRMHTSIRLHDYFSFTAGNEWPSNLEYVLTRIFTIGQTSGDIRNDLEPKTLALYFKLMYTVSFLQWLDNSNDHQHLKGIKQAVDLFISGAGKRSEQEAWR